MTATSPNFGWVYPNSGADPVSAALNFAHVGDIDTTVRGLTGNIMSLRIGKTPIMSVANEVVETPVTLPTPLTGDDFVCFLTGNTSAPGSVVEVSVISETSTGFTICTFRETSTAFTVNWLFYGITVS